MVKNLPANAGACRKHSFNPRVGKIPWGGNGNPSWDNPMDHGERNLADYNTWGHKESDTTENACMHSYILYFFLTAATQGQP